LNCKLLTPEDIATMKRIGTWVGLMTLGNDAPITRIYFDIKGNLNKALNRGFLLTYLMFMSCVLKEFKEEHFAYKNPYFNSLFSLLLETLNLPSLDPYSAKIISTLLQHKGFSDKNSFFPK